MQAYFVLQLSKTLQVSCTLRVRFCKALLPASELPTSYAHFFIISLNPSSAGSMKWIPRKCPALSSFGFSIARLCFSLRFDASDTSFQISGHRESLVWMSFAFLSVSPRTRYIHPVVFCIQHRGRCKTCPRIWQFSISINVPIIVEIFSSITSSDVLVALVTSIYFSGIGNDASLGTYSLTLGCTWWR